MFEGKPINQDRSISRRTFVKATSSALAVGYAAQGLGARAAEAAQALVTLPALPFAREALAPLISARTLEYHYGKHHQGYVNALNQLLIGTGFAGETLEEIVKGSAGREEFTAIFNNAAQVWNHTFYWDSLSAEAGARTPSAALGKAIDEAFGSFEACQKALASAAMAQFGSGWAWLVAEKGKVRVTRTPNAETPLTQEGVTPLLTLDVWEHAYYLDWQNRRADYAQAVIAKLSNWSFASANFAKIS